ncbi:loricrin-like [Setaria italica]|uniref:loricrin-like n=1 Tax=Setaria italica TaxID=4555 RepID=UPI00035127F4|nr:loricrin-like [Setaria italica]
MGGDGWLRRRSAVACAAGRCGGDGAAQGGDFYAGRESWRRGCRRQEGRMRLAARRGGIAGMGGVDQEGRAGGAAAVQGGTATDSSVGRGCCGGGWRSGGGGWRSGGDAGWDGDG